MAHAAALKAKHAIEAQEEELRRKKEQLELDAQIAASTAKITVLQKSDNQRKCSRSTSSTSKSKKGETSVVNAPDNLSFDSSRSKCLHPNANEYVPVNSMPVNTAGAAGVSASQDVTQNQRNRWNDQQIFHTSEQSNFHYSAQMQHDNL